MTSKDKDVQYLLFNYIVLYNTRLASSFACEDNLFNDFFKPLCC